MDEMNEFYVVVFTRFMILAAFVSTIAICAISYGVYQENQTSQEAIKNGYVQVKDRHMVLWVKAEK